MSKAESKLIDSMIEVSILGIREKPSLSKSLYTAKDETTRRDREANRRASQNLSIFEHLYGVNSILVVTLEKSQYRDLGEHI
jgi:hypothetical protein